MKRLYPLIIKIENGAIWLGKKIIYYSDKLLNFLIKMIVQALFVIPIYAGIWFWAARFETGQWLWFTDLAPEEFNNVLWMVILWVYWSGWNKKNDD